MNEVKEKRVFPRYPLRTKVVFEDEFGEGLFYVYSKDISLSGLFLDSAIPVRVGTLMFLSFKLPSEKEPLRLTGEAIRVSYPQEGMGISFAGLTAETQEKLSKFLAKHS